jgi:hypothetical protein
MPPGTWGLVPHPLGPEWLDPHTFYEDRRGQAAYGYRTRTFNAPDWYEPDQLTGASYRGSDFLGLDLLEPSEEYRIELYFRGLIVGPEGTMVAARFWSVRCPGILQPMDIQVPAKAASAPGLIGDAVVRVLADRRPGSSMVNVTVSREPEARPVLSSDVAVQAFDDFGRGLALIGGRRGEYLLQSATLDGNAVGFYEFALAPGRHVAVVNVTLGGVQRQFALPAPSETSAG